MKALTFNVRVSVDIDGIDMDKITDFLKVIGVLKAEEKVTKLSGTGFPSREMLEKLSTNELKKRLIRHEAQSKVTKKTRMLNILRAVLAGRGVEAEAKPALRVVEKRRKAAGGR